MWKRALLLVLLLCGGAARAQKLPERLAALEARYKEAYAAGEWRPALDALEEMSTFAEVRERPALRANVAYNRACLTALLGRKDEALAGLREALAAGFSDLRTLETDHDLDALRADARFATFLADARAALRPKPLAWDGAEPAIGFPLRFDDAGAPGLQRLRTEYALDQVVAGASDELERVARLARWASAQWTHSPTGMASRADPLTILREAKAGGHFICRDYAIVVAGAARALGFPARVISVLPRDVETRSEAHAVAEVWLSAPRRWVLADGQFGVVPTRGGNPLNAVELRAALAEGGPVTCLGAGAACAEWSTFIGRNLHYFKVAQDQRRFDGLPSPQLVLVPKGSPAPRSFAGNQSVFAHAVTVSNPASFYEAPPRSREGVPEILAPEADAGIRSEVLVVGTAHLAELASAPGRAALAPVLAALGRYRPTVICVEHLLARDIAEMDLRGGTFRDVALMFASHDLRLGPLTRTALSRTREEAAARAEALLARAASLGPAERRELVSNLVAAYELPTALLQWSLLPEAERRAGPGLPPEVASHLDRTLASANETSSIAVPLARAAGLARLVSVDSQWDGGRLLQQPEAAIEEAFGHPGRKPAAEPEEYVLRKTLIEEAPRAGSLLPLFVHLNSPAFGAADVKAQWGPWLRLRLPSGVDRLRYGNWEARNAAIVAHLAEVTASPRAERVLLLIGAAHKPFVEDLLGRLVHVKLARFEDLVPPG